MINPTTGIAAVVLAGIFNGSFPAPTKRVTEWKWEHLWIVYSFFGMAALPLALASVSGLSIVLDLLTANIVVTMKIAAFGALWGLGSVLFGVSLVRLGMAITNALISGLVVFFGSLGPVLVGAVRMDRDHLLWLVGGLSLLALSLGLCAAASISRDQSRSTQSPPGLPKAKQRSLTGVVIAIVAGLLSSMLNLGFVVGSGLADQAIAKGYQPALASVVIWVPVLLGGLVFNIAYPAYVVSRNHSWDVFLSAPNRLRCFFGAAIMGLLWFGGIELYGFGASAMGGDGAVYGWGLIVAVSILTSNAWGAATGEWSNSGPRPKVLMWLATGTLMSSLVVLVLQHARG